MALDNSEPDIFDTKMYRGYQLNGPYIAYIVWPAVSLHKEGPLLSKGVAEGTKSSKRSPKGHAVKEIEKSRPSGDRTTKQYNQMSNDMNDMSRTCHLTSINVQYSSEYSVNVYTCTMFCSRRTGHQYIFTKIT